MPLVHYFASSLLSESRSWNPWALSPPASRVVSAANDWLQQIRNDHVFFNAGPCCYAVWHPPPRDRGDVVLYFPAMCRGEVGNQGHASPFDTGSLGTKVSEGVLQPFGAGSTDGRLSFLQEHSVPLEAWREQFARWLTYCYDRPLNYIETSSGDRYLDGKPSRTIPKELLEQNGPGAPRPCADRRAWTWELRLREAVSCEDACLLHVTLDALEVAADIRKTLRAKGDDQSRLQVRALSRDASGPGAFYDESGEVLRILLESSLRPVQ
jgi:hypothetical protein